jgi:hypothetical protein
MDEFMVFDKVLSADEVKTLFEWACTDPTPALWPPARELQSGRVPEKSREADRNMFYDIRGRAIPRTIQPRGIVLVSPGLSRTVIPVSVTEGGR